MTAMLSCPVSPLYSYIVGKLTFVHLSVFWSSNTNVPTVDQVPIDLVQKSEGEYASAFQAAPPPMGCYGRAEACWLPVLPDC